MFEKEAEEYLGNFADCANCKERWSVCADSLDEYCLANGCCYATPKEQDTYIVGAEFGYNKALEEATHNYNAIIADYDKRIAELEAQIEKMKCCGNCKYFRFVNGAGYYTCIKDGKRNGEDYRSCGFNLEKWEGEKKRK